MKIHYTDIDSEDDQDLFIFHFGESCYDSRRNLVEMIEIGISPFSNIKKLNPVPNKIYEFLTKTYSNTSNQMVFYHFENPKKITSPNDIRNVVRRQFSIWEEQFFKDSEYLLLEVYLLMKKS